MTIKHLVLGGGGPEFSFYLQGIITKLEEDKVIEKNKIEAISMTSAGALAGSFLGLKISAKDYIDYIINRPYKDLFDIDLDKIINCYDKMGIFNVDTFKKLLAPILEAEGLSIDVTLKEFYDYNGINMHYNSTVFKNTESKNVDISHKTHPGFKLYNAIYASCCLPIMFQPLIIDNAYYLDGFFWENTPINSFQKAYPEVNIDDVLILCWVNSEQEKYIAENQTLISFLKIILGNYIISNKSGETNQSRLLYNVPIKDFDENPLAIFESTTIRENIILNYCPTFVDDIKMIISNYAEELGSDTTVVINCSKDD